MKLRRKTLLSLSVLGTMVIVAVALFWNTRFNDIPHVFATIFTNQASEPFPQVQEDTLTPIQKNIVTTLRKQVSDNPPATKYSQGVQEPWCADFVSYVMKESGVPLKNPNSGSWRIPGTYTLRDYYKSIGKFKPLESGYEPKVGDVVLYDNPGEFGQHTNIVIKNDKGVVTTVGGNEPGGVRVFTNREKIKAGIVGYGVL